MNRIVTLKGPSVDSQDEYVLTECLKIMFPNCEVEIRSEPAENSRDKEDRWHVHFSTHHCNSKIRGDYHVIPTPIH